jgi:hypothetical protein
MEAVDKDSKAQRASRLNFGDENQGGAEGGGGDTGIEDLQETMSF